ncbi:hypothetical protein ABBQ38_000765 [Trebouxia sp. C0009 RCD-2024]
MHTIHFCDTGTVWPCVLCDPMAGCPGVRCWMVQHSLPDSELLGLESVRYWRTSPVEHIGINASLQSLSSQKTNQMRKPWPEVQHRAHLFCSAKDFAAGLTHNAVYGNSSM